MHICSGLQNKHWKELSATSQKTSFIFLLQDYAQARNKRTVNSVKVLTVCLSLFCWGLGTPLVLKKVVGADGLNVGGDISLGSLHMKGIQHWVSTQGLNTPSSCKVAISVACMAALHPWKNVHFLTQGLHMGMVQSRKLVTKDASLSGCMEVSSKGE